MILTKTTKYEEENEEAVKSISGCIVSDEGWTLYDYKGVIWNIYIYI